VPARASDMYFKDFSGSGKRMKLLVELKCRVYIK
jgi:hypothetical protein